MTERTIPNVPGLPPSDPGREPETDDDKENGVLEAEPSTPDPDVVVSIENAETGEVSAVPI